MGDPSPMRRDAATSGSLQLYPGGAVAAQAKTAPPGPAVCTHSQSGSPLPTCEGTPLGSPRGAPLLVRFAAPLCFLSFAPLCFPEQKIAPQVWTTLPAASSGVGGRGTRVPQPMQSARGTGPERPASHTPAGVRHPPAFGPFPTPHKRRSTAEGGGDAGDREGKPGPTNHHHGEKGEGDTAWKVEGERGGEERKKRQGRDRSEQGQGHETWDGRTHNVAPATGERLPPPRTNTWCATRACPSPGRGGDET